MRRFLIRFAAAALSFFVAAALAVYIFIGREASPDRLKPRVEEAASGFLGRPLTIDALEWRRWPRTALIGTGVRLYEDAEKTRVMVESPRVEARVTLISLLKLAAGVSEIDFVKPRLVLRRGKDGIWNLQKIVDEISARPAEPGRRWGILIFNWFAVEDGTLVVEDARREFALPDVAFAGRGKLRFGRERVHFPFQLQARLAGAPTTLDAAGDLGSAFPLELHLKRGDFALLRRFVPAARGWDGRWDADVHYRSRPSTQWRAELRAVPIAFSTAAILDALDASCVYEPDGESSVAATARSSGTVVEAKAAIRPDAVSLQLRSPDADLARIAALARAVGTLGGASSAKPGRRLKATLQADRVRYGEIVVRDLRASVRRSTGPYVVDPLTFQSLNGSVTANASYAPFVSSAAVMLAWRSSGVSAQDLFRLAGSATDVEGVLDSDGRLTTVTGPGFLRALNGEIKLDFKDGWLGDMPGLLKVLSRLNIATLLSEVSGKKKRRIPFHEARGAVKIENGKAVTESPFVLENKTLQMAFMGSYDLPTRVVDGRIVVNFLTVTDELIHLIPGVRDILLGGEKGLVPIFVDVKGKSDDPDVKVISWRSVTDPAWNALNRAFHLPKKLLQQLKIVPQR